MLKIRKSEQTHTHMNKVIYIFLALLALSACDSPQNSSFSTPPNIILVITDDQGYGDLGIHGNPFIRTPVLDSLAMKSTRIDPFYVSPVCAPTRASLMTGRYHLRTGVYDTYNGGAMMSTEEVTIAEVLADNGYHTAMVGKWHLGDSYPMRPMDQGFQYYLAHKGGGIGQPGDDFENFIRGDSSYFDPYLWENGKQVRREGYCSDIFTDQAVLGSSAVGSTIRAINENSIIVKVTQSIREPAMPLELGYEFQNLSENFEKNSTNPRYIIYRGNKNEGIRMILNKAQNARNQWKFCSIGKFEAGSEMMSTSDAKIGEALQISGYLITKSALKIALLRWKKKKAEFDAAVKDYIEKYPVERQIMINDLMFTNQANRYEKWLVDPLSSYKKYIRVDTFDDEEAGKQRIAELESEIRKYYDRSDKDTVDDVFEFTLHQKVLTERNPSGKGSVRTVKWYLYHLDYTEVDSAIYIREMARANSAEYLSRVENNRNIPYADATAELESRFKLEFMFARIPTNEEMEQARKKDIELQFASNMRAFSEKMGIKDRVQTVWEIQQELRSNLSDEWETMIKTNLVEVLNKVKESVDKGKGDVVNYKSLQSLLGKGGEYPEIGLLKSLEDISQDVTIGNSKLTEMLEKIRNSVKRTDPKTVSRDLDTIIKELGESVEDNIIDGSEVDIKELDIDVLPDSETWDLADEEEVKEIDLYDF